MESFLDEVSIERALGESSIKSFIQDEILDGFRLFIRGIDDDGRVANYVETEQILLLDQVACSYIQVKTPYIF